MPDFFGKLKSGAEKVAFEADKMARLNHAQGEVGKVKRQIEAQFMKLGQMVYQHHANPESESPDIEEICQNISQLEKEMEEKQAIVQQIDAETFSEQSAQKPSPEPQNAEVETPVEEDAPVPSAEPVQETVPETKFCTNCGKEIPATTKFCPECGQKV